MVGRLSVSSEDKKSHKLCVMIIHTIQIYAARISHLSNGSPGGAQLVDYSQQPGAALLFPSSAPAHERAGLRAASACSETQRGFSRKFKILGADEEFKVLDRENFKIPSKTIVERSIG